MVITRENERLTDSEMEYFTKKNKLRNLKPTGEVLHIQFETSSFSPVVFTGTRTPYDTVRDCGDHYIYAGYSRYYKIDKQTLEILDNDAEDR